VEQFRQAPDVYIETANAEGLELVDNATGDLLYAPRTKKLAALDSALRRNGAGANYDRDALSVATLLRRYWGDESVTVLERALALAKEEAAR
jgi:hypothetical protein